MAGKGDARRPTDDRKYGANYDLIRWRSGKSGEKASKIARFSVRPAVQKKVVLAS